MSELFDGTLPHQCQWKEAHASKDQEDEPGKGPNGRPVNGIGCSTHRLITDRLDHTGGDEDDGEFVDLNQSGQFGSKNGQGDARQATHTNSDVQQPDFLGETNDGQFGDGSNRTDDRQQERAV